jgi:hypothetical protein
MNIALGVENILFKKGDEGKTLDQNAGTETQKAWKACNFTFNIDGFDDACKRVTKIDSFTVKQTVLDYHSGGRRGPSKAASAIDFPQISFYLPEADVQPLADHLKKRAVDGEVPGRLHGQLTTFDNAHTTKFTLQFFNADILNMAPDKSDSMIDEIKQVKIDMYVERMSFQYTQGG